MKNHDYYLRCTDRDQAISHLRHMGIDLPEDFDRYHQDDKHIVEWLGKIPNPVETDEEGELIGEPTFKEGLHINIRSTGELDFSGTCMEDVWPDLPYRRFS